MTDNLPELKFSGAGGAGASWLPREVTGRGAGRCNWSGLLSEGKGVECRIQLLVDQAGWTCQDRAKR